MPTSATFSDHFAQLLQRHPVIFFHLVTGDLPNKIRDALGIMADVNLVKKAGKELIEIHVEPYPYPVSYKGEYHYRSGSTKQELKGAALDRFLLQKRGRTGTVCRFRK